MKFLGALIVLVGCFGRGLAGRAFPVDSENFVTELFQSINPGIEWDPTNFLVDLSGQHALCKFVYDKGYFQVNRNTPDGASIGGLRDYESGSASDANSVKQYIKNAMPRWLNDPTFSSQITRADYFGCSVQPGCKGYVSIACLFSPAYGGGGPQPPNILNPTVEPKAQAFTPEQYDIAEALLGQAWDNSHFLENLSGAETDCSMINMQSYSFPVAHQEADIRGMHIFGIFGADINRGSTEEAMITILDGWKDDFYKYSGNREVGCSLIPDCMLGNEMWVVISCIVEE